MGGHGRVAASLVHRPTPSASTGWWTPFILSELQFAPVNSRGGGRVSRVSALNKARLPGARDRPAARPAAAPPAVTACQTPAPQAQRQSLSPTESVSLGVLQKVPTTTPRTPPLILPAVENSSESLGLCCTALYIRLTKRPFLPTATHIFPWRPHSLLRGWPVVTLLFPHLHIYQAINLQPSTCACIPTYCMHIHTDTERSTDWPRLLTAELTTPRRSLRSRLGRPVRPAVLHPYPSILHTLSGLCVYMTFLSLLSTPSISPLFAHAA
jgi:hypothetical protein